MTEVKYNIGGGREMTVKYDDYGIAKITRELLEDLIKGRCMWEEVLQELDAKQKSIHDCALDSEDDLFMGEVIGIVLAIDIIKQKLAEIEE